MRRTLIYSAGIIILASACDVPPPVCGGALQDACRKASDLAYAVGVQIADESNDANPVLGDVSTMGATGKAAVSFRVHTMSRSAVRVEGVTARTDGNESASTFPTDRQVATAISVSGAVGAWGGVDVGSTQVGGIDLLGNLVILGSADRGDVHLSRRPFLFGAGVRLGLLRETRLLPSVSLTAMLHEASKVSVDEMVLQTNGPERVGLRLENEDVSTRDVRVGLSKKFGAFGLAGGVGRSVYSIDADYFVQGDGSLGFGNQSASFDVRRTNAFVGATYTRKTLTFGAEFGRLMSDDASETLNTFGDGATAARNYLSLGVRIPAGRSIPR